jgi:hypothetical protein
LGRQAQARAVQRVTKAPVSRTQPRIAGDRTGVPARPSINMGGVGEGPTRGGGAERSSPASFAVADGGKASWPHEMVVSFAGRPRNVGLGRSARRKGSPPLSARAPMTADAQRVLRKGTTSACVLRSACTVREEPKRSLTNGRRRVLHLVLWPVHVDSPLGLRPGQPVGGGALQLTSWSGKPGESLEEATPGLEGADDARLAAARRFRKKPARGVTKGRASRRPSLRGS